MKMNHNNWVQIWASYCLCLGCGHYWGTWTQSCKVHVVVFVDNWKRLRGQFGGSWGEVRPKSSMQCALSARTPPKGSLCKQMIIYHVRAMLPNNMLLVKACQNIECSPAFSVLPVSYFF